MEENKKEEQLKKEQGELLKGVESLVNEENQVKLAKLDKDLSDEGKRFADLVGDDLLSALEGKGETATFEFQSRKLEELKSKIKITQNQYPTGSHEKSLLSKIVIVIERDLKKINDFKSKSKAETGKLELLKQIEKAKSVLQYGTSLKGVIPDVKMKEIEGQERIVKDLLEKSKDDEKVVDSYVLLSRLESETAKLQKSLEEYQIAKKETKEIPEASRVDIAALESRMESNMPRVKEQLYADEYKKALFNEGNSIAKLFAKKVDPLMEKAERLSILFNFSFPHAISNMVLEKKLKALRDVVTALEERKKADGTNFPPELGEFSHEIITTVGTEKQPAADSPEAKLVSLTDLRKKADDLKKALFDKYESGNITESDLKEQLSSMKSHYREIERQEVLILGNQLAQDSRKAVGDAINVGGTEFQKVNQLKTFIGKENDAKLGTTLYKEKSFLEKEIKIIADKLKDKKIEPSIAIEKTRFLESQLKRVDAMIARAKAQMEYFNKLHPSVKLQEEIKKGQVKQALQSEYDSRLPTGKKHAWFGIRELMKRYYVAPAILGSAAAILSGNPFLAAIALYRPLSDVGRRIKEGSWALTTDGRLDKVSDETIKGNQALENLVNKYETGNTSFFGDYLDQWKAIRSQKHIAFQRSKVDETYQVLEETSQKKLDKAKDLTREMWSVNVLGRVRRRLHYWRLGIDDVLGEMTYIEGGAIRSNEKKGKKDFDAIAQTLGQKNGVKILQLEGLRNKKDIKDEDIAKILGSLSSLLVKEEGFNGLDPVQKIETAILFLQKLDQETLKKHTRTLARPAFMAAPDNELKSIEKARQDADTLLKKEYEDLPGYPRKVGDVLKKHGVRYEYRLDQYKDELKLWSHLNFDPFFSRVVSRQLDAFGAFLEAQGRAHEYDFQVQDLGIFRELKFNMNALDFNRLWRVYSKKKDNKSQKMSVRDFLQDISDLATTTQLRKAKRSELHYTYFYKEGADKHASPDEKKWNENADAINKLAQNKTNEIQAASSELTNALGGAKDTINRLITSLESSATMEQRTMNWSVVVNAIMKPRQGDNLTQLREKLENYVRLMRSGLGKFANTTDLTKLKPLLESLDELKEPDKVSIDQGMRLLLDNFKIVSGDEQKKAKEYWEWKKEPGYQNSANPQITLIAPWEDTRQSAKLLNRVRSSVESYAPENL